MALPVPKSSFAGGELDPALYERTTLEKFKSGMATARNVVVTKIGTITSRPGRFLFKQCKLAGYPPVCYSPPGSGLVMEWGHLYVRLWSLAGVLLYDLPHPLLQTDIPSLQFETSGSYVYIFCAGKLIQKLLYTTGIFVSNTDVNFNMFAVPEAPTQAGLVPSGTPTGYSVEYACTLILNGQEGQAIYAQGPVDLPILPGQSIGISITATNAPMGFVNPGYSLANIYRRPTNGGAYGYIGSTSAFSVSGSTFGCVFQDLGQDADYTHSPPTEVTIPPTPPFIVFNGSDTLNLMSKTGCIYQQRLIISDAVFDLEAIYASRPGYQNNFYQDFPLNAASALQFKAGSSGYARVLRMLDSDGLVVFTTAGIFLNQGELGPDNLSLVKKGQWIINQALPALAVPGGCMFVDVSTNSIRNLVFNLYTNKYEAPEVSIFSNHLFRTKQILYWNFQEGAFPLLYVTYADGTFSSFTFEFDQQMQAWTRHDSNSAILVNSSAATIVPDTTFFVVTKGNISYIEQTIPRYPLPSDLASNPETSMGPTSAYMDSLITFENLLNNALQGTDVFKLTPTTISQDWSQPLNLNCGTSKCFPKFGVAQATDLLTNPLGNNVVDGSIGQVYRYFDSDGTAYDLKVISGTDANNIVVSCEIPFPSEDASGIRLYLASSTFIGLGHLNGEFPAVIVDGAVVCSPNNDVDNYPAAQVVNGTLTLPNNLLGAIVHIGRPIIGDIETLDIDTVDQQPTLIESLNVDKLYIKVFNSGGLFVGNKFPVNGNVVGMESLDSYDVDYSQDNPIIGNRAQQAQTKRVELTLPGDWKSQGKICIRQVDPLHFEILSIIPDCEVLQRSDR